MPICLQRFCAVLICAGAARNGLRALAFGAHCSNSLHGFSNKDKYVTSYFFRFFFDVLLRWVWVFFESLELCADGAACFLIAGVSFFLLDAGFSSAARFAPGLRPPAACFDE